MAVRLLKNYIAPYFNQNPYHPSLSFHQLPCSSTISTIFRFSFHISSSSSGGFSSIDSRLWFSFSVSHNWVGRFFTRRYDPLRLISFPTELKCFQFAPVFLSSLLHKIGRFFTKLLLLNRRLSCSTKLVFKKKGNCNVMITRLINHMILARDHSHDQLT